jgi:hypothetical protein
MAATSSSISPVSPLTSSPSIPGGSDLGDSRVFDHLFSHHRRLSGTENISTLNTEKIIEKLKGFMKQAEACTEWHDPYYRSKESGLARTVYVVPTGTFMLLTRKSLGDLMVGGSTKRTYTAINLATNILFTYYSCKEKITASRTSPGVPTKNEWECLVQARMGIEITAPTFPKSAIFQQKKDARYLCYLGHKMEGDLCDGISSNRIDLNNIQTRFNLVHQIADVTARFQTKAKEIFGEECVHRDLKPDNYLYDFENGELVVRLIDFERVLVSGTKAPASGTGHYVDPDILKETVKGSSSYAAKQYNDSWSLGMTLIKILFHAKAIDVSWLMSNPNLHSILIRSAHGSLMLDLLEFETQDDWIEVAPSKDSIEYVIYLLLQLHPANRCTIRQAADYLLRLKNRLQPEVSTKATDATAESLLLTP